MIDAMDWINNGTRGNNTYPDSARSGVKSLLAVSAVAVLFGTGWLMGQNWPAIKRAYSDAYLNRYLVMSQTGVDSIVYYVTTKDGTQLAAAAAVDDDIISVEKTSIKNLYDVTIKYSTRVSTVKNLRQLDRVDAVITIPLFCH